MLSQTVNTVRNIFSASLMTETIESRFGTLTVDTDKAIYLPHGVLGFPGKTKFVIAAFPNPKMQQFTVLQCLDDLAISFITLPLPLKNNIIAIADLQHVCRELHIPEEHAAALLIVNVHRGAKVKLAVNARAPLMLNVEQRTGEQYVFQNDRYDLQHML